MGGVVIPEVALCLDFPSRAVKGLRTGVLSPLPAEEILSKVDVRTSLVKIQRRPDSTLPMQGPRFSPGWGLDPMCHS